MIKTPLGPYEETPTCTAAERRLLDEILAPRANLHDAITKYKMSALISSEDHNNLLAAWGAYADAQCAFEDLCAAVVGVLDIPDQNKWEYRRRLEQEYLALKGPE